MMLMALGLSGAVAAATPLDPEALLAGLEDIAGQAILAQGEPSFEAAAGLLPELVGYVPVSSASADRKLVVGERGEVGFLRPSYERPRIAQPLFDPHDHLPDLPAEPVRRELIDGRLPGVRYTFVAESGSAMEETVFLRPGDPEVAYAEVVTPGGRRCFGVTPELGPVEPAVYDAALAEFRAFWLRELLPAIDVDLPEPRLVDASIAAIARASSTFVGDHPKYGLGVYAQPEHDGFPPTVLWMTSACLEWGLLDRARAYLSYYFDHFVQDDGTFAYYGPAVSEYGQMLDLVARYVRYTGDGEWLEVQRRKVAALAGLLVSLRERSLEQPTDAITRGLLYGSPEADTREETQYYLSGTAWGCRGLLEAARLGRGLGWAEADGWAREAEALRSDLNRAARGSLIPGDPPFVPPYPGLATPFQSMTADTLASYTNYRYGPELLAAGALDQDLAEAVFEYRRRMGGELAATTRFGDRLDDWPLALQARALLADDRVEQYLLALYGHLALQQTPGTYCAYEQVAIRGEQARTYAADYCVPAQLTIPLMVRWMLVCEDPDAEMLWLCRAVPRRWLAPGNTIRVRNAPTRWGPVSFEVRAEGGRVVAEVLPPPRLSGTMALRVRLPGGELPTHVSGGAFDPQTEAVVVTGGQPVTVALRLR